MPDYRLAIMEENDRKELEDLLIEAREKAVGAHLKKGNIKFLKFIAVIATLNFILFPFDYQRVKPDLVTWLLLWA